MCRVGIGPESIDGLLGIAVGKAELELAVEELNVGCCDDVCERCMGGFIGKWLTG